MIMKFAKMQGAGNDYVYIDLIRQTPPADFFDTLAAFARRISDRHFGIGSDGLILIMPSEKAEVRMRMFNADGSESAMCGNGIRCLAKYVLDEGIRPGPELTVETGHGVLNLSSSRGADGLVSSVSVDMGAPKLAPQDIPVVNLGTEPVVARTLGFAALPGHYDQSGAQRNGVPLVHEVTLVSMGNPHCVIFFFFFEFFPVRILGPIIENDSHFPERCNVHFVQLFEEDRVRMRTWERGSGETLACGTGASAVAVALGLTRGWRKPVHVTVSGGELQLHWQENDRVLLQGPAVLVYRGEIDI
jgi:diaminopimelate epimerase